MKTIAAISTAAAPGGIGIIRISGPQARAVGDRVFHAASGEKLHTAAGYTCRFGHVYAQDGSRLDECIATVFAAPKSFTGEDVVMPRRPVRFESRAQGGFFGGGFSGGAGRIYAPRIFERQDGSRAGRGRDGADFGAGQGSDEGRAGRS